MPVAIDPRRITAAMNTIMTPVMDLFLDVSSPVEQLLYYFIFFITFKGASGIALTYHLFHPPFSGTTKSSINPQHNSSTHVYSPY
jgi:hypothetical protein